MFNHQLLSDALEARNMSQKDLANSVGMSEATVSRYLNGEVKDQSWPAVVKMCEVLGISLDVLAGREAMIELPSAEGKGFTENLVILRDILRRNFERIRTIEHEKDNYMNRHIEDLVKQIEYHQKQVERYSAQFRRYVIAVFSLIALCMLLIGIMLMMFVKNRELQSDVEHLQSIVDAYEVEDNQDQFPE